MRKKLSNKVKIKIWQLKNDVIQSDIAEVAGVTTQCVSLVMNGRSKNQAVINAFIAKGCPREYFEPESTTA